jgi:uncharacterized protein (DUF849 family)
MNREVIITCAVCGDNPASKNPHIPITPEEIAAASIEAAKAGAAITHIHVRDLETKTGSRDIDLFTEVVERIRESDTDVIINLTAGIGALMYLDPANPGQPLPESDMLTAMERLAHIEKLKPEICALDCGTIMFGGFDLLFINLPTIVREMAKRLQEIGVKPELEAFDSGHLAFINQLIREDLIDNPPMIQLCLGIPWGAPATTATMLAMVQELPTNCNWTSFGVGASEFPMAMQSVILGGNIRVGLEDNLYLKRGVLASNTDLVENAARMVERMGGRILSPAEARVKLQLSQPE